MSALTYESLSMTRTKSITQPEQIDKSSHFYHVMTRAWGHEAIFSFDIAQYRSRLLGKLCEDMGITIIFSVVMPNHTHDVLMANSWEDIVNLTRQVNSQISRLVRKTRNWRSDKMVFERHPLYVAIKDIANLLYVGKYIYDNPLKLAEEGRHTPYSCFWTFENSHPGAGYNPSIYKALFGLDIEGLLALYSQKTKKEVLDYANRLANTWTKEQTSTVFLTRTVDKSR